LQTSLFANSIQITHEFTPDGVISAELVVRSFDFEGRCERFNGLLVGNSDGNNKGFSGLTMNVELS
jgi:hypothetical protein